MSDLEPGQVVGGRYRVEQLVGQGGLSSVYRVRHVELGSVHALKLLTLDRPGLADRLLLEGRIQAQLRHPNVVVVTDVLRQGGDVGLLMEFVGPQALDEWLVDRGPLPLDEALALFTAVTAGLVAAHDVGVLHRDLKPANVLLQQSRKGIVAKVTDFGIAKVLAEEGAETPLPHGREGRTGAGGAVGTPGYMAPEQARGLPDVDVRADLFSLAALLYELLAGKPAFADDLGRVTLRSTLDRSPPPLDQQVAGLPADLVQAIHQALNKDRDRRYPDVRTFARLVLAHHPDLLAAVIDQARPEPLYFGGGTLVGPSLPASVPAFTPLPLTPAPAPAAAPPPPADPPRPGRGIGLLPWILLVGGSLAVAAGLLSFGLWLGVAHRPEAPPLPAAEAELPPPAPPTPDPLPRPAEVDAAAPAPAPTTAASPPPDPRPLPAPPPAAVAAAPTEPAPPAPGEVVAALRLPEPPTAPVDAPVDLRPATEPVPEPAPEPEAPTEAPALGASLLGRYVGTADRLPFELRLTRAEAERLEALAIFTFGATQRTYRLSGTTDGSALDLSDPTGSVRFQGRAAGDTLSGTYSSGKKALNWEAARR